MNNGEKSKYFSCVQLLKDRRNASLAEVEKARQFVFGHAPKRLYKFRKFDKYSVDMLERNYVYLPSAQRLDDPFDCLVGLDNGGIIRKDFSLSRETAARIIKKILKQRFKHDGSRKEIGAVIDSCLGPQDIEVVDLVRKVGECPFLDTDDRIWIRDVLNNLPEINKDPGTNRSYEGIARTFLRAREIYGVCSFSADLNNKVLWSQYADTYKGYCVEYEIPFDCDEVMTNLYPVIYKKKRADIAETLEDLVISMVVGHYIGTKEDTLIGCLNGLVCTKDTDWAYQNEWRLIGKANSKRFGLKIARVYLGFDVSPADEAMLMDIAKSRGISVYKMNKPTGESKITYVKL